LLGVGIWLVVDKSSIPSLLNVLQSLSVQLSDDTNKVLNTNTVQLAAYILIAAGAIILVISFLGCCGACLDSKCLLTMYSIFLIIVLSLEIAAVVYAVVARTKFEEESEHLMVSSIKDLYGVGGNTSVATVSWNAVMHDFQCCGARDYEDFEDSKWKRDSAQPGAPFPPACCKKPDMYRECQTLPSQYSNYKAGCFEKIRSWIKDHLKIILGVAIGVAVAQLFGIVLSIYLCCSISPVK